MPKSEVSWSDLLNHIKGEGTPEERKRIEQWIAQHPEGDEILRFLSKTEKAQAEEPQNWDVDSAWQRFNEESKDKAAEKGGFSKSHLRPHVSRSAAKKPSSQRSSGFNWKFAVAAAITFVVSLLALQLFVFDGGVFTAQEQSYFANNGERVQVEMKDGTRITLNSGSKMWISATDDERNVRLTGQAFFDVTSDPGRPFIVKTERSTTQVLGTRFEVKAYPGSEETKVVVEHGRVRLAGIGSENADQGQELTENQIGYLHENGTTSVQEIEDPTEYLGWRNGKLQFNDQSLKEIVATLERSYDVEISIKDANKQFSDAGFTGTFSEKQPITEVLDAITMVLNLNYQQSKSDDSYILYK